MAEPLEPAPVQVEAYDPHGRITTVLFGGVVLFIALLIFAIAMAG